MDKLIRTIFLLLFPTIALVNYGAALDDALMPRFLLAGLFVVVIFFLLLIRRVEFFFPKPVLYLWLSILLTVAINFFVTDDSNYWFFVFGKLSFFLSFYFVSLNIFRNYDIRASFIKSLFLTLILVNIKVIIEIGTLQIDTFEDVFQVNGGFGHKNILSAVLLTLSCASLSVWNTISNKWSKLFFIIVQAFTVSLLIFLQTRSIWLIGVLLFGFVLIFARKGLRLYLKPILLGFSFCSLVLISYFISKPEFLLSSTDKINIESEVAYSSVNERLFLWSNSCKLISDDWIFGVGAGNWKSQFQSYGISGTRAGNGLTNFIRPHNDFLWITSEFGILGAICFIAVSFYAFRNFRKQIAGQLLLYFVPLVLIVFSLFSFPLERPFLVMLFIIPFVFESSGLKQVKNTKYVLFVLSTISCFFFYNRFRASIESEKVIVSYRLNNNKAVLRNAEKCLKLGMKVNEQGTAIDWYKGVAYSNLGEQSKSLQSFINAYRYAPNHVHVINNLASSYHLVQDNEKAEELYVKGIQISKDFDELYVNYAAFLYNEKRYSDAYEIINLCPTNSKHSNYKKFLKVISAKYLEGR